MRFLLGIAALALPLGGSSAQQRPDSPPPQPVTDGGRCDDFSVRLAEAPDRPKLNNLGELPPGDVELAVQREVDGCIEPVIVRQDMGGSRAAPERVSPVELPEARARPRVQPL